MSLFLWLKAFTEGQGIKTKFSLVPATILTVFRYGLGVLKIHSLNHRISILVAKKFSPAVLINNRNGLFLCRKGSNDFQIVAEAFERSLTKYLDEIRGGIFIDIGANIGRYTVKVARQMGPSGLVVAIEPDPENFKALIANIDINKLTNVRAINVACWNRTEDLSLSIAPDWDRGVSSIKEKVSSQSISVKGIRLDDILTDLGINNTTCIKIDVEGAEEEVIQGAVHIINNSDNLKIIFESWNTSQFNKCKQLLEQCGMNVGDDMIEWKTYLAQKHS